MLDEQVQDSLMHSSPQVVFERMIEAANRHDLEAMVACFAPDFRSEQPFYDLKVPSSCSRLQRRLTTKLSSSSINIELYLYQPCTISSKSIPPTQ